MANRSNRLVQRIQGQLQSFDPADGPGSLHPRDVAELEVRVHRLHQSGRPYRDVGLSRYVTRGGVTGGLGRTGGIYVATDV